MKLVAIAVLYNNIYFAQPALTQQPSDFWLWCVILTPSTMRSLSLLVPQIQQCRVRCWSISPGTSTTAFIMAVIKQYVVYCV